MQRRDESGRPVKGRRAPKARKAPTAHASAADLQEQVAALTRELKEAREQQTASSEVLKVISSSAGELQTVFDTILTHAVRICEARFGNLALFDGVNMQVTAMHNAPPEFEKVRRENPTVPSEGSTLGVVVRTKQKLHIIDLQAEPAYATSPLVTAARARSMLAVPMLKETELVGAINIYRQEVRPFTDKQIELLQNFASQAVIAIENTRLLSELRESLQQQTATADVLQVISSSPGDLQPVFDAMLANATKLCEASYGALWLREGGSIRAAALHGALPGAYLERLRGGAAFQPRSDMPGMRAMTGHTPIQVTDMREEPAYLAGDPLPVAAVDAGIRSLVVVPMYKDDQAVGNITIYRREVRPFSDKQVELLANFAAQAVIAIENTRLLNELRESLQQQTATADVLQVISSSPGELEAVFQTMLENATRLCGAKFGHLYLCEGDAFRSTAMHNVPETFAEFRRRDPLIHPEPGSMLGRLADSRATVHIQDVTKEQAYIDGQPRYVSAVKLGGFRSMLGVPMLKDGALIGAVIIYRQGVSIFSNKQIELVTNFAAQAVIAIENTRLLVELRESLQQQTATADVLKVIASSMGELAAVFSALLANATRLCEANYGALWLREGDAFRTAALHGPLPQAYLDQWRSGTLFRPAPDVPIARVAALGQPVQVADLRTTEAYRSGDRLAVTGVEAGGIRTVVAVPMLKDKELLGVIAIYRTEVNAFADKQIALVQSFASQAVIAIENTRLLSELREALDQQTATSEVLKVISNSVNDTQPVFDAIVQSGIKLFPDALISLALRYGDKINAAAIAEADPARAEAWRRTISHTPLARDYMHGAALLDCRIVDIPDVTDAPAEFAAGAQNFLTSGYRAITIMPMMRGDEAIGLLSVVRGTPGPLSDKQFSLLRTFAAQGVIAIENARILGELRESLQQQTATADVLKVISRSTFDLQPVLDALTESAAKLCEADMAGIVRPKGGEHYWVTNFNFPPAFMELVKTRPIRDRGSVAGRALLEGRVVQVSDVLADPDFTFGEAQKLGGYRTVLGVPLLREGMPIGVIILTRSQVRPFTEKQIELVTTFADQAVIAIENVRLFDEVQARTRELAQSVGELRALGEVTQAVNSTVDLETVLTTIVAKATQLSNTEAGAIYVFNDVDREFHLRATYGLDDTVAAELRNRRIGIGEGAISNAVERRMPIQIPDVQNDPSATLDIIVRAGFRALLIVPLLSTDRIVGALVVRRKQPGEFQKSTVELLQTFAGQSVLAIQNARLFESVEARTRELAKSLEELRTAQDRLVQTEKLASLGQLTAGIAHEIKNPLNFVNNFSAISVELIDELREALAGANLNDKLRAQISEIADMLQGNLDKVVQHGKRADSIVKNMLLHSRQGSQEHRPVDINALVEESLNLAYHGARAEKQGFNITLKRSFDPATGEADVFPQEITRVLLNLISNGFYAATKRKADANGGNYEPTLAAATKNLGDSVEIRIRDNGTGIPPEVKEKMFNPFFTTKPVGEGTGLGLSISHDIIVKQHGGSIEVDTQPGEFTEFRIVLPRRTATVAKSGGRA